MSSTRSTSTNEARGARAVLRGAAGAALAVALLALAGGGPAAPSAEASIPTTAPVFTNPLDFGNPFFPFQVGAVKVFSGRSDGVRTTVVDSYDAATRDFAYGGGTVTCRLLREVEFERGELTEISYNWFAEADDGTVWYFGEVVDNYEDGEVEDNEGSWLVGGPVGADPPETATVTAPALFMPGNPEIGDQYMPEDVPDGPEELDTIRRVGRRVVVPAGRLTGCLEVGELDVADGARETKWYAPGIGVVKAKGRAEILSLDASTLR